jgi:hypothetical protein
MSKEQTKQVEAQAQKPTMADRVNALPTLAQLEELGLKTMAAKIRHCRSLQEKEDRGAIAKALGIKYQWVRNVLTQKVGE